MGLCTSRASGGPQSTNPLSLGDRRLNSRASAGRPDSSAGFECLPPLSAEDAEELSRLTARRLSPEQATAWLEADDGDRSGMLRVVCISDTHNDVEKLGELPPGDVLIHAGDL